MPEPIFDRNAYKPERDPQERVIESASASTAPQANNSKFAYILTAAVLGVLALLAIAVTLFVFAVATTGIDYAWQESSDTWLEDDFGTGGYEETWL